MSNILHYHNKTLNPRDYQTESLDRMVMHQQELAIRVPHHSDHRHRRWEYGIIMDAIRLQGDKVKTILEIGGGASLFAPLAAYLKYDITVVEPQDVGLQIEVQNRHFDWNPIKYVQADYLESADVLEDQYDAVVALSVVEHVEDHLLFLSRMAAQARHFMGFTTDFSIDGETYSPDHLRTYAAADLLAIRDMVEEDFELIGDPQWTSADGNHVFTYNFASFAATRRVHTDDPIDLQEQSPVPEKVSGSGRKTGSRTATTQDTPPVAGG